MQNERICLPNIQLASYDTPVDFTDRSNLADIIEFLFK